MQNAKLLKCPFCGTDKEVTNPNPENIVGGILWSDGVYENASAPAPSTMILNRS